MQVYWSTKFIIPCAAINKIESILKAFLWKGSSLAKGGLKVAWSMVCRTKEEGGLGIKAIRGWNKAVIMKQIWCILSNPTSNADAKQPLHCQRNLSTHQSSFILHGNHPGLSFSYPSFHRALTSSGHFIILNYTIPNHKIL
ncbi:reverse transcriptase domain, Reverse transcriptase zinc-binding [Salix suchowensis]|nr:reverse transcriptase domain, Reverse transcriptase zinc-binding [Salix suchowensis]